MLPYSKIINLFFSVARKYACSFKCGRKFVSKQKRKLHEKCQHPPGALVNQPFECDFCGKFCAKRKALRYHFHSCHLGAAFCFPCNKNYKSAKYFQRHIKTSLHKSALIAYKKKSKKLIKQIFIICM